jgi:hypothetical protein
MERHDLHKMSSFYARRKTAYKKAEVTRLDALPRITPNLTFQLFLNSVNSVSKCFVCIMIEAVYRFCDIRKIIFNLTVAVINYTLFRSSCKPFLHSSIVNSDSLQSSYSVVCICSIVSKLGFTLLPSFANNLNHLRFSSYFGQSVL